MVKNKRLILFICVGVVVFLVSLVIIRNNRVSMAKKHLFSAIENNDMPKIERILEEYPSLINEKE